MGMQFDHAARNVNGTSIIHAVTVHGMNGGIAYAGTPRDLNPFVYASVACGQRGRDPHGFSNLRLIGEGKELSDFRRFEDVPETDRCPRCIAALKRLAKNGTTTPKPPLMSEKAREMVRKSTEKDAAYQITQDIEEINHLTGVRKRTTTIAVESAGMLTNAEWVDRYKSEVELPAYLDRITLHRIYHGQGFFAVRARRRYLHPTSTARTVGDYPRTLDIEFLVDHEGSVAYDSKEVHDPFAERIAKEIISRMA